MPIAQDNTVGNLGSILGAIPGLSQAVNGSSETTTSSGISSQGMSALLQQILSGTNGLASVAVGQNTAGLYNSTVQQQSVNDLLTRASGEVAAKGPTTTTAVKAPTINLGQTLLEGAAGVVGSKAINSGLSTLGSTVSDALGITGGSSAGGLGSAGAAISGASPFSAVSGAGATGGFAVPASAGLGIGSGTGVGAGAAGAAGTGVGAGGLAGATGAGAIDAATAAGIGAAAAGTAGAVGAATAGGLAAGGATLGGIGGAIAGEVAASTAGIAAGAGVGAAAAGAGAAGASSGIGAALTAAVALWVICTELEAGGEMSYDTYKKAAPDFISRVHLKPSAVRGYHYWAVPYTRVMRRKDWIGRFARAAIKPLALGRADYINGRWNLAGWITFNICEPVCSFIGNTLARKNTGSWKSLYKQDAA